jgi:hypothetical protein
MYDVEKYTSDEVNSNEIYLGKYKICKLCKRRNTILNILKLMTEKGEKKLKKLNKIMLRYTDYNYKVAQLTVNPRNFSLAEM